MCGADGNVGSGKTAGAWPHAHGYKSSVTYSFIALETVSQHQLAWLYYLILLYYCWVDFPSSLQYFLGHHFTILWWSVCVLPPSHFAWKKHKVTWLTEPYLICELIYEFPRIITAATQSLSLVFWNPIQICFKPKFSRVNRTVVLNSTKHGLIICGFFVAQRQSKSV